MTEKCGHPTTQDEPCQNPKESCPWHNTADPPETGRPTKLTMERQEGMAQMIERGDSIRAAARSHGLHHETVLNWIQRGEEAYKNDEDNIYRDFFDRLTRARGEGENTYKNAIMQIAIETEDARLLMSMLKQRYPDSWGDAETGVEADTTVINVPESVTKQWQRKPNR